MGCGDLVLELRTRLLALAAGDVLLVRATDPGAPGDLPAWCRVTHHTLLHHDHPHYWIRRRTDAPTSPATST
jgi:tRNA 2-thiouridine synthesizing protein A